MKLRIIYPKWRKLERQTEFHLPPHGPVVFASAIPPDIDVDFVDENVDEIDFSESVDVVAISMMLTAQVPRGWEIADRYRERGTPVIFGGIATMLHAQETMDHADAVFLGEAEGRFDEVIADLRRGELKSQYNYIEQLPPTEWITTARRDILRREAYNYGGVQMVDLLHASRGCRFNCYPCCVSFLGGRHFRPRPLERVAAELESIDNDRLFLVDNSLAQDTQWELELFRVLKPFNKRWICHPLEDRDLVVHAAADAGCWYVYQAVFEESDKVRTKVKRLKDHGIGVEATVLLGMDYHTEYSIRRLIDFVLELDVDMAEFTVLTPFPQTQAFRDLERQGRILSYDWSEYTADRVVFKPKHLSVDRLQELYCEAWDTFYADIPQRLRMYRLLKKVL
jgi:radical SAM superfamily enzyme YgiQ (UPF0313 family)